MSPPGFPDYPTSLLICEVVNIVLPGIYNYPQIR